MPGLERGEDEEGPALAAALVGSTSEEDARLKGAMKEGRKEGCKEGDEGRKEAKEGRKKGNEGRKEGKKHGRG
jgi:hypothetical protein